MPMPTQSTLDELVAEFARKHHCPTISWVVFDHEEVRSGGYGPEAGPERPYRIASMTKSYSAATVLALHDRGDLRIDQPLAEIDAAPAGVLPSGDSDPITLADLLSMQSGFVTDDPWADRHLDISFDDLVSVAGNELTRSMAPRTGFEYSNLGFGLVGWAVYQLTGRRLQDHADELVLGPLGLHATTWHEPASAATGMRIDDGVVSPAAAPLADGWIAPMGGLWSTASDVACWARWLDDAFPARSTTDPAPVLRRASRRAMQSSKVYAGMRTIRGVDVPTSYGFGLGIQHRADGDVVAHSGGLPGFGSNMRWAKGRRRGAVALANLTYARMWELTDLLLSELGPTASRPITPALQSAAERLAALLNHWTDEEAESLFADNVAPDLGWAARSAAAERHGELELLRVEAVTDARGVLHLRNAHNDDVAVPFSLAVHRSDLIQSYTLPTP